LGKALGCGTGGDGERSGVWCGRVWGSGDAEEEGAGEGGFGDVVDEELEADGHRRPATGAPLAKHRDPSRAERKHPFCDM